MHASKISCKNTIIVFIISLFVFVPTNLLTKNCAALKCPEEITYSNIRPSSVKYTVTVTGGFTVESSSTNAYWYTNSEGVIYFNIHIHNKDLWSTSGD